MLKKLTFALDNQDGIYKKYILHIAGHPKRSLGQVRASALVDSSPTLLRQAQHKPPQREGEFKIKPKSKMASH